MNLLLTDKVAIINGGATGMGRSCALLFSEEGCHCVIADIKEKEGRQTAADASKKGKEAVFIKCDITDLNQIKSCVDQTIKKFGKIDILVGSAGGTIPRNKIIITPTGEPPKPGVEYTDEKYFDIMTNLNYKGHVFFCKEVVPYMKKQRSGKIVLVSSEGVFDPPGPSVEYHGAKAAIIGLVNNLAYELGPSNINVNGILPGPVKTPFWDPVISMLSEDKKSTGMDVIGNFIPLGRVGRPEDIGYTALFLCSEMSSFITGQMINVSGGLPMQRYLEGGVMPRYFGGEKK
jgi:NAD(P)-dependent dehydrogenase (short-subunit alcohol dehydrogenase family)